LYENDDVFDSMDVNERLDYQINKKIQTSLNHELEKIGLKSASNHGPDHHHHHSHHQHSNVVAPGK
jgi:hypothetical protein